jgi:Tfp pilus assembly protein PilN
MKSGHENMRTIIGASLVSFMIVMDMGLVFIDPFRMQRTFGALLSAELVAFSALVYVAARTRHGEIGRSWLLIRALVLVLLLSLALIVS